MFLITDWKNEDNKVLVSILPRLTWSVVTESSVDDYIHFITPEELESEEPIEIEVKKNEEVIGSLNLVLSDTKLFMQAVQGTILLKKPSDNQFYHVPRL